MASAGRYSAFSHAKPAAARPMMAAAANAAMRLRRDKRGIIGKMRK
jgi:hypothetical protein